MTESTTVAATLPDDGTWRERAACRGMGPDTFGIEEHQVARMDEARAVCDTCSVSAECLGEALTRRDLWTVHGGQSVRSQRRLYQAWPWRCCVDCDVILHRINRENEHPGMVYRCGPCTRSMARDNQNRANERARSQDYRR